MDVAVVVVVDDEPYPSYTSAHEASHHTSASSAFEMEPFVAVVVVVVEASAYEMPAVVVAETDVPSRLGSVVQSFLVEAWVVFHKVPVVDGKDSCSACD